MEIKVNVTEFEHFCQFLIEIDSVVDYLDNKPSKSELDKRIINSYRELENYIDTSDVKKDKSFKVVR